MRTRRRKFDSKAWHGYIEVIKKCEYDENRIQKYFKTKLNNSDKKLMLCQVRSRFSPNKVDDVAVRTVMIPTVCLVQR